MLLWIILLIILVPLIIVVGQIIGFLIGIGSLLLSPFRSVNNNRGGGGGSAGSTGSGGYGNNRGRSNKAYDGKNDSGSEGVNRKIEALKREGEYTDFEEIKE